MLPSGCLCRNALLGRKSLGSIFYECWWSRGRLVRCAGRARLAVLAVQIGKRICRFGDAECHGMLRDRINFRPHPDNISFVASSKPLVPRLCYQFDCDMREFLQGRVAGEETRTAVLDCRRQVKRVERFEAVLGAYESCSIADGGGDGKNGYVRVVEKGLESLAKQPCFWSCSMARISSSASSLKALR